MQNSPANSDDFSINLKEIREKARSHIEKGAVTEAYQGSRETVLHLLNDALATELVCILRYRRHYFMSSNLAGIVGYAIASELLTHANQEQVHADRLAERIVQLGGEPNFDPDSLSKRSHSTYVAGSDLKSMLREDLIAERIAIDTYTEIVRYIGDKDPTTRRLFEDILAQEEEHADELADFLRRLELPLDGPRASR